MVTAASMHDLDGVDIDALLHTILQRHLPGAPVTSTWYLGSGSCNLVYAVTAGGNELIARLASAKHRGTEHQKEAWCIARAASVGVPVQEVLAYGIEGDASYMIQRFAHGVSGCDQTVNELSTWREIGRYAKRIHTADVAGFPGSGEPAEEWARAKWERYVAYGIESLAQSDPLIDLGVYSSGEGSRIRTTFEWLASLAQIPGLSHGDLSLANTIVDSSGAAKLIDWGCAAVGPVPHTEFAVLLGRMKPDAPQFEAFLEGYELDRRYLDLLMPEIRAFRLLQAFDLVRWSIDQRPEHLGEYVSRAKAEWITWR